MSTSRYLRTSAARRHYARDHAHARDARAELPCYPRAIARTFEGQLVLRYAPKVHYIAHRMA